MFNVKGAQQIPLDVFGGKCSQIPAMNVPLGLSPDCYDVAFGPHTVFSRPAATNIFTDTDQPNPTYSKSYVANDGVIRNLFLDADGNLSVENLSTAPGTRTLIGQITPGSYAKSITAFGREYLAFSDGLHGTDVPLQFDGVNLDRVTQDGPGTPPTVTNLDYPGVAMAPVLTGVNTMERVNNKVTVATAAAHNLKVGYRAQIADMTAAQVGGGITSITINNQDAPGLATITTSAPHGVTPGVQVSVSGVSYVDVPGNIIHIIRQGQSVIMQMSLPHGLSVGAFVTVVGTVNNTFIGSFYVETVQSPTEFGYKQAEPTNFNNLEVGNVRLQWPTAAVQTYTVLAAPSANSFQIPIRYTNGTWLTGKVTFEWEGTFFVDSVTSTTRFTYKQNGPDAVTTEVGIVSPAGQISPGKHQVQVLYQTRNFGLTAPSPPATFVANGGQYLSITNIPIGPPNVTARILAFTGADGAYYFYIPVPAKVAGEVVSTGTQIDDNTTTSIILDFSDNTLFASIGISQRGNYLQNQHILDSALGFSFYGERLIAYGQRNNIQNLLNMGFDGGSIGAQITGWTGTGTLAAGHFGVAVSAANLQQSFAQDVYGAPIATPNTRYLARAWMSGGGCTVTISSATTGFSSVAVLTPGAGGWGEMEFTLQTPMTIPSDMILTVASSNIVDDLSIVFAEVPFRDKVLLGSYINNPEGFDGVSGVFGVEDTRKVMTMTVVRGALHVLTRDPSGRLHAIQNSGTTEPVGWSSVKIADNCGVISTFGATVSQADDATGGGGEEWLAWISYTGAKIFGGDQPRDISEEITPDWNGINIGSYLTAWALNDPAAKRIYFGLPRGFLADGVTLASAPNVIYHLDYKNLDSAEQIAAADPMHPAEPMRKWCPWRIPTNGGALIYRVPGGPLYPVFYSGNGELPGLSTDGCGQVWGICEGKFTDDCLGLIRPYYITAAFTGAAVEAGAGLGGQRHLVQYMQWNIEGIGRIKVTTFVNSLSNPWPISVTLPMRLDPLRDDEFGGGQASGQRFFFKLEPLPV